MKRNTLNFVIDAISAVVTLGMVATGLLLRFVLPPGSGSRRMLWGWGRHDWGDLHFWLAVGVGAVIVLHIALHWQWVCVTALRCLPARGQHSSPTLTTRNLVGASLILLLVGVLGGFVWFARATTTNVRGDEALAGMEGARGDDSAIHHEGRDGPSRTDGPPIRGSMKLSEAADACDLTVEAARERLRVPKDVAADEQLGRLAAKYNFSMQQARERLEEPVAHAGNE
jgi:hypothetical protein